MWQANIPHTHLAKEKSDQNWMVVKGDKINFPGGGTHFHYGADKYIASIANVSLLLKLFINDNMQYSSQNDFLKIRYSDSSWFKPFGWN